MKLSEVIELHLDELHKLEELQNKLLEISTDTIENIKEYISSSPFIQTKEGMRQLCYSIAMSLNSRPLRYKQYLALISFLVDLIKSFFTQDEIVDDIFGHNSIRLQLLDENVIDFSTIYSYDLSESTFFFFAPEFKKFYPNYFKEHEIEFRNVDLNEHIKLRSEGMNESEIAIIIRNDDIDSFQLYVSKLNVNLNGNIPKSKYEISFFLKTTTTIIEYAAFYGSLKIFKFLWMNNVAASDQLREFAIAGGNYDIVHILETKQVQFDEDCLNKAIQYHHNEIARYINESFNVDFTFDTFRECIMSYNIEMFLEILNVLEKDVNMANDWGWTALHFATMHGKLDVVKLLCEVDGIEINSKNNTGATPFHWCAAYGHLDIMKFYLKKFGDQIDINVQNLSGVTPLHLASYSGHLYIVKFLVEQPNIDIFRKDDNGTLPLAYGANNPQIVSYLCHIDGFDINCQNFQGNSFLHFAAKRGNTEAVKILLNIKGINVNLRNEISFLFF